MARAFEHVRADDGQVAQGPAVFIFVRDLIVGDQRHQVDAIEALHAFEALEAALAAQVVVGNHDDLGNEFARRESLADLLQQSFFLRGIGTGCGVAVARQKRQTHAQRQTQLRLGVFGRRRAAIGIEKFHQAGGVLRVALTPCKALQVRATAQAEYQQQP